MNADREVVDRVRSAADIVRTIGEYVPLRKAGRKHVGLCPFHAEKTPSFSVDEQKQLFYCFGCGAGGDVFKFVMLHEKLEFPEALKMLAEKNGIETPRRGPRDSVPKSLKERLFEANALAAAYYRAGLAHVEAGEPGRRYLEARGIARQTVERLGIGYAPPGWDGLKSHLLAKGFVSAEITTSGLAVTRADGSGSYDRFRDRIVFPIASATGKIVGFGGRTIAAPGGKFSEPKYLNSPETPIYSKSETLYGLYSAREALKKEGFAVLVEGYLDFASLFEAGIENVVASLGTAFTDGHARLIARYVDTVVVNYDADSAGKAASLRSLVPLVARGLKVKVLRLEAGEDPDQFVRRAGADAYRKALASAPDHMEYVIQDAISGKDLGSPGTQVAALNQILPHLAAIESPIERSRYVPILADRLSVEDSLVLAEVKRAARERKASVAPPPPKAGIPAMLDSESSLVQILIEDPSARNELLSSLERLALGRFRTGSILSTIRSMAEGGEDVTYASVSARMDEEESARLLGRIAMRTDPPGGVQAGRACLDSLELQLLKAERSKIHTRLEVIQSGPAAEELALRKNEIIRRENEISGRKYELS